MFGELFHRLAEVCCFKNFVAFALSNTSAISGLAICSQIDSLLLLAPSAVKLAIYTGIIAGCFYLSYEVRFDFSGLNAIFQVGLDPILHVMVHLRLAVHERNAGTVAPQVERSDCG